MSTHTYHHSKSHQTRNQKLLLFFMIIFAIGFIISLGLFIMKVSDVRHGGPIHPHNPLGMIFSGSRDHLSDSGTLSVDSIEPWMTFAYINFRFHLPPDYLKEKLAIQDKKYPEIPLNRYIKKNALDSMIFLKQVQDIVKNAPTKTDIPFLPPQ